MKTPQPDDLDLAADWVQSCQGEDKRSMARVAEWLREQARTGRARAYLAAQRRSMKAGAALYPADSPIAPRQVSRCPTLTKALARLTKDAKTRGDSLEGWRNVIEQIGRESRNVE